MSYVGSTFPAFPLHAVPNLTGTSSCHLNLVRLSEVLDFIGGLEGVAAIDEYGGLVAQHDRHAGGAGEAGQPGEAHGRRRQILALMVVGMGNDKAGETCGGLDPPVSTRRLVVAGLVVAGGRFVD